MSDDAGRSTAATLFMRIRPGGRPWLRALFFVSRHVSFVTAPLRRLGTIHFLHWTVFDAVPNVEGGWRRLDQPWLWFESNFDENLDQYIDAFARAVPWRMRAVWASAEGYPGLFPSGPYQAWTRQNAAPADYYWCAYPEASTRMAGAALRVEARLQEFKTVVGGADPERFLREYHKLLTDLQADL